MNDEGELLRNQLAKTIRDARRTVKRIHSIAPTSLTDADFEAADWICARFDVRLREPANEEKRRGDIEAWISGMESGIWNPTQAMKCQVAVVLREFLAMTAGE